MLYNLLIRNLTKQLSKTAEILTERPMKPKLKLIKRVQGNRQYGNITCKLNGTRYFLISEILMSFFLVKVIYSLLKNYLRFFRCDPNGAIIAKCHCKVHEKYQIPLGLRLSSYLLYE